MENGSQFNQICKCWLPLSRWHCTNPARPKAGTLGDAAGRRGAVLMGQDSMGVRFPVVARCRFTAESIGGLGGGGSLGTRSLRKSRGSWKPSKRSSSRAGQEPGHNQRCVLSLRRHTHPLLRRRAFDRRAKTAGRPSLGRNTAGKLPCCYCQKDTFLGPCFVHSAHHNPRARRVP